MVPHSLEIRINRQVVVKMVFVKVELNVPLEDSLFRFPAASADKRDRKD